MTVTLEVGGAPVEAELAMDWDALHEGLSNKEELGKNEGMLFVWPTERNHGLIMRDMSFPIDTIYASQDGTVVHTATLSKDGETSEARSKYALEVPAGFCEEHNVEAGDKITRQDGDSLEKQDDLDIELPVECRECGEETRMFNTFQCPECHPDVDPEVDDYKLATKQESKPVEKVQSVVKISNLGQTSSVQTASDQIKENPHEVDEVLTRAIKDQVWPDDLSKTERTWAQSDDVPDFIKEWVNDVIEETDPMYDAYDGVPRLASMNVQKHIQDSLTQPQGWSLNSITNRLTEEFDWMGKDQAENIARQEVAGVLNTAKTVALRAAEKEDELYLYRWVGPDDQDTSAICRAVKSDIGEQGGEVSYDELVRILRDRAEQYKDSGGTPHRIEQMLPHFGCRHTVELVDIVEV